MLDQELFDTEKNSCRHSFDVTAITPQDCRLACKLSPYDWILGLFRRVILETLLLSNQESRPGKILISQKLSEVAIQSQGYMNPQSQPLTQRQSRSQISCCL